LEGAGFLARAYLIVNPTAGAGSSIRKWPKIQSYLNQIGLDFEFTLTESPGHAIELAKAAAGRGYKMFVSVGGDGTISEVAQGLYEKDCLKDVMLGVISTGTGADYIRTMGIPSSCIDACKLLMTPRTCLTDVGIVEFKNGCKRLFVNFAGLGFAADVVKATTQTYKATGPMTSYLLGLLSTLISYRNKEVSISIDGHIQKRKIVTLLVGNGKYAGGGMKTIPNANPRDGLFDVLVVDDMTKLDLLQSLPMIYKGTHLSHPKVSIKRVKEIEIYSEQKSYIQVDGDVVGETPARFRVLPAAMNLIVPFKL
jgi:diacylglycerol kinase (ATP)